MAIKAPKILYFIPGMRATAEQTADAIRIGGPGVSFRNASLIDPADKLEDCDGVAGDVPPSYAARIPHATERELVIRRMARRDPLIASALGMTADDLRERGDLTDEPKAPAAPPVATSRAAPAAPAAAPQGGEGWGTGAAPAAAAPVPPAPAPPPAPPAKLTRAQERAAAKAAKAAK